MTRLGRVKQLLTALTLLAASSLSCGYSVTPNQWEWCVGVCSGKGGAYKLTYNGWKNSPLACYCVDGFVEKRVTE